MERSGSNTHHTHPSWNNRFVVDGYRNVRNVRLGIRKSNCSPKAWHSNSLHVRWDQPAGMGRQQPRTCWDLFHSKAVSVGGIKGTLDDDFRRVSNGHQLGVESRLNLGPWQSLADVVWQPNA